MDIVFHPISQLEALLREIAETLEGLAGKDFEPMIRPADPRHGDYQANGVLPFAKRDQSNPRTLGESLLKALHASGKVDPGLLSIEIAGPGFLNFKFSDEWHLRWLQKFSNAEALRSGAGERLRGETVVVDFSSPNTAKEMHVGHIRSTVIGEAISRLFEFSGARTIRDNHIGDWGTQFGMLIWGVKEANFDLDSADPQTAVAQLEQIYKAANATFKESPQAANAIRKELVKLQTGNPENLAIWQKITDLSWASFDSIYQRLGIRFDEVLGESFYRNDLEPIYVELLRHGIAEESEGALVVFHPEHKRFRKQPFIIRKQDGASNYGTTDLATILYRLNHFNADRMIYVVDSRQSDHFEQLFLTARKWFSATGRRIPEMQHVSFGTVLGEDHKPIKTKEGGSIKLKHLLNEAVERSFAVVREKNPDLAEDESRKIAEAVGLGAVRYMDLSQNRTSDYQFSWERMLSFEGNTAPYLLYAVARIHSIFRKPEFSPADLEVEPSPMETAEESALARKLAAFPNAIDMTLSDLRPHFLCAYLFELAGAFSTFYTANRVLTDDPPERARRLLLCRRSLLILETGLHLLGIETLEKM